jgi:hypothetical protein
MMRLEASESFNSSCFALPYEFLNNKIAPDRKDPSDLDEYSRGAARGEGKPL